MKNCTSYMAAANTCEGFVSYFDDLLKSGERIFILKGGPGCGKSTFMKKVAKEIVNKGYKLDLIYCSSDKDSLDAIFIHDIKVIILDGTAPHVIDPKYPGVVDSIVNFGEYFNEYKLRESKNKIKEIIDKKAEKYKELYSVLKSAKIIHDKIEKEYLIGMNFEKANQISTFLSNEIIKENKGVEGKEIHRFSGALTPQGQVSYYDELTFDIESRYIVKGRAGSGKSTLMNKIATNAINNGYEVEFYHCGLDPKSLDMVIIRELSVAILDGTYPHIVDPTGSDKVIDMFEECIDKEIVNEEDEILISKNKEYKDEIEKAKNIFDEIKNLHEILENIYSSTVDFSKVDDVYKKIVNEILNMK